MNRVRSNPCAILVMMAIVAALAGCQSSGPGRDSEYQTIASDPRRDSELARRENDRAAGLIEEGKIDEAEQALKKALAADVMYGPAHNNLGLVYYHQNKLYLSAWEFQYAVKLMPRESEPKNNLGLVFEAAGKLDEAIEHYDQALKLHPDDPQIIGNAARARIRRGDKDEQVRDLLEQVVLKDTRPQWVQWARQRLAVMPK